jgi:hypothetical protein
LLGIVDLSDGVGTIAPLRLRTADTSLIGAGQVDLGRDRLDLVIKGEKSGGLALDLPLRVSGAFADIHVGLARDSAGVLEASHAPPPLPADLQRLAQRNGCLH